MTRTWSLLMLVMVLGPAACAFAAPPATQPAAAEAAPAMGLPQALAVVGACMAAAIAAVGGAYGVSQIGKGCIESIARQPEAARDMFAPMVVSAGMVEVGMLFAILVCLLKS